jgi:hypothetical protein
VSRIQRVGFEVRVEARTGAPTNGNGDGDADADEVSIQLTRGQADRLDLAVGQQLWLRASHDASALDLTGTPALANS